MNCLFLEDVVVLSRPTCSNMQEGMENCNKEYDDDGVLDKLVAHAVKHHQKHLVHTQKEEKLAQKKMNG